MKQRYYLTLPEILLNTLILGIAGSIFHSFYSLTGEKTFVGLFTPVNESIWEHLKILFFPLLIWWIILFCFKKEYWDISLNTWVTAGTASLITAPLYLILLFYSYTGALGTESIIIDIILMVICFFLSLLTANHILKYLRAPKWLAVTGLLISFAIFTAFIVFTFSPPSLPVFMDTVTDTYGIQN